VHEGFAETFTPVRGTLRMHLADRVVDLRPGESLTVPPGTAHHFSNPGDAEVEIVSDGPAMPQAFAAMLVQLYGVMDTRGAHPITMLLQMSVLDRSCDVRPAGVPRAAVSATRLVLGPAARVLGFRNYYPEHALHPGGPVAAHGAPSTAVAAR
jgi:hypothetical protein